MSLKSCPSLTEIAIAAFQKARPDVTVVRCPRGRIRQNAELERPLAFASSPIPSFWRTSLRRVLERTP